jgi:hypothetical protein
MFPTLPIPPLAVLGELCTGMIHPNYSQMRPKSDRPTAKSPQKSQISSGRVSLITDKSLYIANKHIQIFLYDC